MDQRKKREFQKLERHWYQKLKEDGFEDIEDTSRPDRMLKSWHSFRCMKFNSLHIRSTKIYYAEAEELLNEHDFSSPEAKQIWELHSQGMTIREIAKRVTKYKKSMIHLIIKSIAREIK